MANIAFKALSSAMARRCQSSAAPAQMAHRAKIIAVRFMEGG
jgi:hypothetical protein